MHGGCGFPAQRSTQAGRLGRQGVQFLLPELGQMPQTWMLCRMVPICVCLGGAWHRHYLCGLEQTH